MRELQNSDVFAFGRILTKANLKEEIKNISISKEADVESLGFDIMFAIITHCADKEVEHEIYSFLASLFEMSSEDVAKLDPIDTITKLNDIADWKRWKSFFSLGVKLTK